MSSIANPPEATSSSKDRREEGERSSQEDSFHHQEPLALHDQRGVSQGGILEERSSSERCSKFRGLAAGALANFGIQYNYGSIAAALLFVNFANATAATGGQEEANSVVKSVVYLGSIVGMCTMGFLGDWLGRDQAFIVTSFVIIYSILAVVVASMLDLYAFVVLFRFGLGVGIGGYYPLSSTTAAEGVEGETSANEVEEVWQKCKRTGWVFAFQSVGALAPYALGTVVSAFPNPHLSAAIISAMGMLFPLGVLLLTWNAQTTTPSRTYELLSETPESGPLFCRLQRIIQTQRWELAQHLIATGVCWFCFDIAYYGSNQWTPAITSAIYGGDTVFHNCWHAVLDFSAGVPSSVLAIYSIRLLGIKRLQVFGFLLISLICLIMAVLWSRLAGPEAGALQNNILFALYLVFNFAVAWGPNVSTFILPQLLFPLEVRTTLAGVAAAMGKVGAIAGIWMFQQVSEYFGVIWVMAVMAVIMLIGAILSYLTIPSLTL